jgi:hypothetical protein
MKKARGVLFLLLCAFVAAVGAASAALADEEQSVSESFAELKTALDNDPNISPEVKKALNKFGKAVSKMEEQQAGGAVVPNRLSGKISEWFASKDRVARMDRFFGTYEEKGLLDRLKLFGDFRFRLESTTNSGSSSADPNNRVRTRYRVRFRFGGEYEICPTAWVGARVTTGTHDNQQSPHQTLDHNLDKWDVNFDRIYLHWAPFVHNPLSLGGDTTFTTDFWLGKFNHYKTFIATPLSWDSDVQPEGLAVHNVFKNVLCFDEVQLNLGAYALTENADQQDAWMGVYQMALKKKCDFGLPAPLEFTVASGLYYIQDTDTNADGSMIVARGIEHSPTLQNGVFQSDYHIWDNIFEVKYKGIEFLGKKRPLKLTFQYLHNFGANDDAAHRRSDQDNAFGLFAVFGETKKRGDWRVGAAYVYVEQDAVYPGVTTDDWPVLGNMKGGWLSFEYVLWEKTVLKLWGLWDDAIDHYAADSQDEHFRFRMQIDIKF